MQLVRYNHAMASEPLTTRQAAYVKHLIDNPHASGTQAAIAAGVPPRSAANRAMEWNRSVSVRETVQRALEDAGLTPATLARKLAKDVDAEKVGLTKDGQAVPMGRDSIAAVKALELAYRLGGALDTKIDVTVSGAVIHLTEAARDPFAQAIDVTPDVS